MESLFEPDQVIFLTYGQESNWKKKWLELKIRIHENKIRELNYNLANENRKNDDDLKQFECCSRTRPPPSYVPQYVSLDPVYQKFSNPSSLISSSHAPITPIWKSDDDQESNILISNQNDSDCYFQEDDNQANYDFLKPHRTNDFNGELDDSSFSSPEKDKSTNIANPIDDLNLIPKYVPQKGLIHTLIPTPQWTLCNHFAHLGDDNSKAENEMLSFESNRQKSHIEIEIIQRRIQKHQLNLPINVVISHIFIDLKILPTNKEMKLERKYKIHTCRNQIPPNWEQRAYDEPSDILHDKEIELWQKLMKNELSKELINKDVLIRGLNLKQVHIRSSDEFFDEKKFQK
ncbi:hypothetical protein M9Y10_033990 [Tritrichomonas musculus]|uniref:Uncharacterized protein n=1 Tax=Tritrichomonas musculus TaxID=1915356 RepID=A0ABR2KDP7_9EUKA